MLSYLVCYNITTFEWCSMIEFSSMVTTSQTVQTLWNAYSENDSSTLQNCKWLNMKKLFKSFVFTKWAMPSNTNPEPLCSLLDTFQLRTRILQNTNIFSWNSCNMCLVYFCKVLLYIHWNFTFLYVQFSISCCDGAVLMVWLGLSTEKHLVRVGRTSQLL